METVESNNLHISKPSIPWFGARKAAYKLAIENAKLRAEYEATRAQLDKFTLLAHRMVAELKEVRAERDIAREQVKTLGGLSTLELEFRNRQLQREIAEQTAQLDKEKTDAAAALAATRAELKKAHAAIVATDDITLLQEVGIYQYRHPLSDVVAYQSALAIIEDRIKTMARKDGGAVLATTDWTVNGSASEGRAMVRDFSKLMLRAFNAEADNLVRGLKPYKLDSALDRLKKVAEVIERLGKTMKIRVSPEYSEVRARELELTADYLQKEAETKEAERQERERLREERKAQQEIERERERLEKEHQHYANAFDALVAKGDTAGAARIKEQLAEITEQIKSVDFRAANIRAGYVYVISNIGSFGEKMVKIGMTRRLDPMDRIHELSGASVPFNFDVHALFFSKDAVGIEAEMHKRLEEVRVNTVNLRREFFRAHPHEVKGVLGQLAGELLEYTEVPEALEYRQGLRAEYERRPSTAA